MIINIFISELMIFTTSLFYRCIFLQYLIHIVITFWILYCLKFDTIILIINTSFLIMFLFLIKLKELENVFFSLTVQGSPRRRCDLS